MKTIKVKNCITCPFFNTITFKRCKVYFCSKEDTSESELMTSSEVKAALTGFPDWCPLEDEGIKEDAV